MSQPVIIKNKIVYGYMDKATVCRDMGRADYNDLTEAQQLNGDVCFIQGVDASAFAPTNSLWNKVGTTPLDSELPADCSNAINQLKSNLNEKSNLLDIVEINRSAQFSLEAGQASNVEWNIAREGYTPLGIVGLLGSGTSGVAFQDHYINGTKAYFYLRNVTSSRVVISNLRVRILYVKNS